MVLVMRHLRSGRHMMGHRPDLGCRALSCVRLLLCRDLVVRLLLLLLVLLLGSCLGVVPHAEDRGPTLLARVMVPLVVGRHHRRMTVVLHVVARTQLAGVAMVVSGDRHEQGAWLLVIALRRAVALTLLAKVVHFVGVHLSQALAGDSGVYLSRQVIPVIAHWVAAVLIWRLVMVVKVRQWGKGTQVVLLI